MRTLAAFPLLLLALALPARADEPARKFGRTLRELVEDLKAEKGDMGSNAAILGEFGKEAFEPAMELARDSRASVRHWGLYVLGRVGGPVDKLLPVAEDALASDDEHVKIGSAMVLARCGKRAGPLLNKALTTERGVPLTWFLGVANDLAGEVTGIEDGLASALVRGCDWHRDDALKALVARGEAAGPAAAGLIKKGDADSLKWGCEVVKRLGPAGAAAVEELAARLGDEKLGADAAKGVEQALAATGAACVDAARKMALSGDPDPRRLAAVRVLSQAGAPAVAAITEILASATGDVRTELLKAAAAAETPSIAALSDASRKGPEGDRLIATRALAAHPGSGGEALPALARALGDESAKVRMAAWEGITAMAWNVPAARDEQLAALKHPDPAIRAAAVPEVFARLVREYNEKTPEKGPPGYVGSRDAAAVVERAIADPEPEVARAALACLRDWQYEVMPDVDLRLPHPLLASLLLGLDQADDEVATACEGKVAAFAGVSRVFVKNIVVTIASHPARGRVRLVRALAHCHADARPVTREMLVEFLADEDEAVREEAKKSIEALKADANRR